MEEISTIKGRILTFLAEKGIKKSEFYQRTGLSESNFKGKNRISQPGGDIIVKILTSYPELSSDWLIMGRGGMLQTNRILEQDAHTDIEDDMPIAHPSTVPGEGIPLIPFEAMAGALTAGQTVLEYECERYVVPAFSGADFLITVKGDSMLPTYKSGDLVACKRVPMSERFFQWNKAYVVDTNQGALIKRIKPAGKGHLYLISDNKDYDPIELPASSIYAVALVIGVIRLE